VIRISLSAKAAYDGPAYSRQAEPVTFGVALPRGLVTDHDRFALVVNGAAKPTQTRVLDRWRDGSARWILVDTQLDVDGTSPSPTLFLESVTTADTVDGLKISTKGNALVVNTGAAVFHFVQGGGFPFSSVSVSAREVLDTSASRLRTIDASGREIQTTVDTAAVEASGPVRATIVLTGRILTDSGALELISRIDLFAGSAVARVRLTMRNPAAARHNGGFWDLGDPRSVYLKDFSLTLALPHTSEATTADCSPERFAPSQSIALPFELYQDSSGGDQWRSKNHINRFRRVPTTFRGYRTSAGGATGAGLRATPVLRVSRGRQTIAVTVPHFWENFPKAVEADGSSLTVRFLPKQSADDHEIQPGEQKTHECFFAFAPDRVDRQVLDWCRRPTVVCVDPAWTLSTEAVAFLAPLQDDHSALVSAGVEGPHRFEAKRETIDEYGWRHFGDLYGDHEATQHQGEDPLISHYNNQYDPVAGFGYQFLRTCDPRWWSLMQDLAAHVIDIDVYHTQQDKTAYNGGMFWHTYHYGDADTSTHRTHPRTGRTHGGGPSAGHNYTTGLMLHYFLTGDPLAKATVCDSAHYIVASDDGRRTIFRWLSRSETGLASESAPGYHGPGRAAANSVVTLVNGHRMSGDRTFLDKAEALIRRVIHPHERIADRQLDNPEQRWFYTMFLQSLGYYLGWKQELDERDFMFEYGRHSLLHYARWMVSNERPTLDTPEKVVFPTETWPAQDIRKSDSLLLAAMHASDNAERTAFLDRGTFFHDYAINALRMLPTRVFTRPLVILLTSGLLRSFVGTRPFLVENPDSPPDFGLPERFITQREIAIRRARWIAICSGLLAVLLAILWLLR